MSFTDSLLYYRLFSSRLIEVTLSNQINSLPFHLHICLNRSCMDELDNSSNRYYHLEEISSDDIDLGKDCELIPVAHYTRVSSPVEFDQRNLFQLLSLGKYHSD